MLFRKKIKKSLDESLKDPIAKAYDDYIKYEVAREEELSKIVTDHILSAMNKDGSDKGNKNALSISNKTISSEIDKPTIEEINSLKWVITIPKKKDAKVYELCNDKANSVYSKLNNYIITHRQGYFPVILYDFKYQIIKTGIMRKKK